MEKSQIRVLIVEDDQTLGKALAHAVKAAGYNSVLCHTPTDAINQLKFQDVQLMVIDCLLPKMSGVDLAVKLRKEGGARDVPLILTSGIFRDKNFSKDALQRTGAEAFLSKPFDIPEFLKLTDELLENMVDEDESPFGAVLCSVNVTAGEKIAALNKTEVIDGFDLPWACLLLMHHTTNGVLRLENTDKGEKAAVHICKGKIVQVEMKNPESYFGSLLIEKGFLEPEQLEQALHAKSTKRIGERLVEMNFISPHVIDLVNADQMAMRLSQLVCDCAYKIKFEPGSVSENSSYLDKEGIAQIFSDWGQSKIPIDWLKSKYLRFADNETQKTLTGDNAQHIWNLPPLVNNRELIADFEKGATLTDRINSGKCPENAVYLVLHSMICFERIRFKKSVKPVDESGQIARLTRINNDMQTQDHFSILGVNRSIKPADLKRTYHDLAKSFHPDKLPPGASPRLVELAKAVFAKMQTAYETLSNDSKKSVYLKELEMGKTEKILAAESLFEEGKALLKSAQYKRAKEKFDEAAKLRPPQSDLLVHMVWASLLSLEINTESSALREAEATLNRIPPEDRHNAHYYFVKGLFQKTLGDIPAAKKNLQHALSLNPKFLDAERVLRVLELQKSKSGNLLTGDLKDVVGLLFKKK